MASYIREFLIGSSSAPPPSGLSGLTESVVFNIGGSRRRVLIFNPKPTQQSPRKRGLLVIFHGSLSSAEQMREVVTAYRYDQEAQNRGWIVAYPDSDHMDWNDCRLKSNTGSRAAGRDV